VTSATLKPKLRFNLSGGRLAKNFGKVKKNAKKIPALTLSKGKKIGALPKLTRKGYTFKGWWTKKRGGEKVTKNTRLTKDKVIYAHWTKK
jgi:uncharacterized repeat protein (TIGR02543 family)